MPGPGARWIRRTSCIGSTAPSTQTLASSTRLAIVEVATPTWENPASRKTSARRAGPACAPSASPSSDTLCGTQSSELPHVERQRHRVVEVGLQGVLRERLDREDRAALGQVAAGVPQGTHRVAQVVQRVEVADQVVRAGVRLGVAHLEGHPVGHPGRLGRRGRSPDRLLVVVDPDEPRPREGLRHQDRGRAEAAAHVDDADARLEPLHQAVHRRQPLGEERLLVEDLVEAVDAGEEARVVLVPADALAGGVRRRQLVDAGPHRRDHLVAGDAGERGGLVGEHHRVLGGQGEAAGRGVVRHVARGGLGREPFARVALRDAGALGEIGAGHGLDGREGAPEAESLAEVDEHGVVGECPVAGDLAGEGDCLVEVERGLLDERGHWSFLSCGSGPAGADEDNGAAGRSHAPVAPVPAPNRP